MPKEAEVTPIAEVTPMDDGNREFPISCSAFVQMLKGTVHEVWGLWLAKQHGREARTIKEWHAVLDQHRNMPAHPSVL